MAAWLRYLKRDWQKRIYVPLICCLILLGSCGILYGPGYHLFEWKSSYVDTYNKEDTLFMPVWICGFHEHKFKYRYVNIDLPLDSMFLHFELAMSEIPFVYLPDTIRFINLKVEHYDSKQWHDDSLLVAFVKEHDLPVERGVVVIPILSYFFSEIWHVVGFVHAGTNFNASLNLWLLVFDHGKLVYRQRSNFKHHVNLDEPHEYDFQLEQHHWDSVVQMGFKEYISRMK